MRELYLIRLLFLLYIISGIGFADVPSTIVITCASGELGGATAKLLAENHPLILTGRNLSKLTELQEELTALHPWRYEICALDYTQSESIENFKSHLSNLDSSVSGLVLIAPRPKFLGKNFLQEEQRWLEAFQTGFTGPLEVLKGVLPNLERHSKIVVIAGITSEQFIPDAGPSCILRRMWTTSTKALSHQLGPQTISINAVSPGVIMTKFHHDRIQKSADDHHLSYDNQLMEEAKNIPLRRNGQPKEVAETIKFLLSKESDFINGVNLLLDGGLTTSY